MKRIVILTNEYPPQIGGIGQYIAAQKQVLGDRLQVFFVDKLGATKRVIRFFKKNTIAPDELWVHHALPIGTAAAFLKITRGQKYKVFLHGLDFDTARNSIKHRLLLKFVLRYSDGVIVNSRSLANDVFEFSGVRPTIIYPALPADVAIIDRKHVAHQPLKIISVGRLIERKGFHLLIEALYNFPNFALDIYGAGSYLPMLKAQLDKLKLKDRVTIYENPTRAAVLAAYQAADIFAMPTIKSRANREGFGIVYLEAQANGLPIIASDYPEMREALSPNATLFVQPNADSIRAALTRLQDAALRQNMAAAGNQYMKSAQSPEKFTKATESLYA